MIHNPVESYGKIHRIGEPRRISNKNMLWMHGAPVGQYVFCQVWVCAGAAAGTTWLFGCPNPDTKANRQVCIAFKQRNCCATGSLDVTIMTNEYE